MPRKKRMLNPFQEEHGGIYHCISRVVNRDFVLQREEKEHFVALMRLYEQFCGVRVLTFCVMSNHFHILLEVPPRPAGEMLTDEWILQKLTLIYSPEAVSEARFLLEKYASLSADNGPNAEHPEAQEKALEAYTALREKYLCRMWKLDEFMKVLKQRFTQWFNRKHKRTGTLWEQRYKSVIVEGGEAARVISAYIDLNPVRAGMVQDPKDYRWCGYGEAVAGVEPARVGLCEVMKRIDSVQPGLVLAEDLRGYGWRTLAGRYRLMLFGQGRQVTQHAATSDAGEVVKRGYTSDQVEAEEERAGALTLAETLRVRVRYFTDGAIIGSQSYVNEVFEETRDWFGPTRKRGAKPMLGFSGRNVSRSSEGLVGSRRIPKIYAARHVPK